MINKSNKQDHEKNKRFSISKKIYLFITLVVFIVTLGTASISYLISANQIDSYFKQLSQNSAQNFAAFVDGDFFTKLKIIATSDKYQQIRETAESEDDEAIIEAYLKEQNVWNEYIRQQSMLDTYLNNMKDIKYLYIIDLLDKNSHYDMYLMDDSSNPCYQTGYFEEREPEFLDTSPADAAEPTITNGVWGWLCSAYAPVYNSENQIVCYVGCDVDMEEIMTKRHRMQFYIIINAVIFTGIVLIGSIIFIKKIMIKPFDSLVSKTHKFKPMKNVTYEDANVIDSDYQHNDEIKDLYKAIRSMQIDIIDYLNDISKMQENNQKYIEDLKQTKNDLKSKEKQIGQISKEAYRDSLTKVGNKAAYLQKSEELNKAIIDGSAKFAIIMIDLNDLKKINDTFGHEAGDKYIQGCCHMICETYKHSPVYRIGGDEFVVIMQGFDYDKRYDLYEDIENAFFRSYENKTLPLTERYSASIGMTEYTTDDKAVEFVFKRADKIMYENKTLFKIQNGSYR